MSDLGIKGLIPSKWTFGGILTSFVVLTFINGRLGPECKYPSYCGLMFLFGILVMLLKGGIDSVTLQNEPKASKASMRVSRQFLRGFIVNGSMWILVLIVCSAILDHNTCSSLAVICQHWLARSAPLVLTLGLFFWMAIEWLFLMPITVEDEKNDG